VNSAVRAPRFEPEIWAASLSFVASRLTCNPINSLSVMSVTGLVSLAKSASLSKVLSWHSTMKPSTVRATSHSHSDRPLVQAVSNELRLFSIGREERSSTL